jgi:hydroxypyruvate reductase
LDGARNAVLIAFATDGDDGLSPAAGAIVTGNTMYAAGKLGLNAAEYLTRHDSYSYFAALDAAIVSGPTGTNVNDLVILLVN